MGSVSVTATGPVIYAIHLGDDAEFLHSSPILKLNPPWPWWCSPTE